MAQIAPFVNPLDSPILRYYFHSVKSQPRIRGHVFYLEFLRLEIEVVSLILNFVSCYQNDAVISEVLPNFFREIQSCKKEKIKIKDTTYFFRLKNSR